MSRKEYTFYEDDDEPPTSNNNNMDDHQRSKRKRDDGSKNDHDDRQSYKSKERKYSKDDDVGRDRDRDSRDKYRDRDKPDRDRRDRDRDRDRDYHRDKDRDHHRDRYSDRDRPERDRDNRDRDRDRDSNRNRGRDDRDERKRDDRGKQDNNKGKDNKGGKQDNNANKKGKQDNKGKDKGKGKGQDKQQQQPAPMLEEAQVNLEDLDPNSEEYMMAVMGIPVNFDTTKGKKVEGADVSAARVKPSRQSRQYMNRRGGFNKFLEAFSIFHFMLTLLLHMQAGAPPFTLTESPLVPTTQSGVRPTVLVKSQSALVMPTVSGPSVPGRTQARVTVGRTPEVAKASSPLLVAPSQITTHDPQVRKETSTTEQGITIFNESPNKGLEFLFANGIIQPRATDIAKFFKETPSIDKAALGDFIGRREELNQAVLTAFLATFEFQGMEFDLALR